jgi:hypothetical protein
VKPSERMRATVARHRTAALLVSGALVLLATFPGDWQNHSHWARVAWLPFLTGHVRAPDLIVNVLLYLPLGATLQWGTTRDARFIALAAGVLLSASMELAQVWSHNRFPSATDVVMNVGGCILGAYLARRHDARFGPSDKAAAP